MNQAERIVKLMKTLGRMGTVIVSGPRSRGALFHQVEDDMHFYTEDGVASEPTTFERGLEDLLVALISRECKNR